MYIYSVCSIFQCMFCLYLFLICRPLISFTNFIKSPLDCHMGVTWFDAARWLAAARRLKIFYQNIFNTRSAGWSYDYLSDITWNWWKNKLCISFSKPCDFANGPDLVAQLTGKTPVTAELHVGLRYKASCGHGSRTWQLMQQATCPSFARNHWLK